MFANAIVRSVPATIRAGITSADLGKPDLDKAREQHERHVAALEGCGLKVTVLDADSSYPDSVFVEDAAVVTDRCAVVTNPGAAERRGEVQEVERTLAGFYEDIERVVDPGTVDGGDVLQVRDRFYVGLTWRTNREGAEQLSAILRRCGYQVSFVGLRQFLHLKTGVAHLGGDDLVVAGELVDEDEFRGFDRILVPPEEEYGANCVRVNDRILVAAGYETVKRRIVERGYEIAELEMSEFRKVDGGLSCLSLRLPGVEQ
ncbi:MAG: dimethylarginine dimethylaminohydrolase family protein [Rubrobacter sp.]